jgi:methionine biosynthesis protein MetW
MQVSRNGGSSSFLGRLAILLLSIWYAVKRTIQSLASRNSEGRQISAYDPKPFWQTRGQTFVEEENQRALYWQHEWMLQHLSALKPRRVLEVGCGFGRNLRFFKERLNGFTEMIGTDFSESMLDRARQYLTSYSIPLCVADAVSLPFPDESFDLVILHGVFMHIPPALIETALSECKRVTNSYVMQCEQNYSGLKPDWQGIAKINDHTFLYDYPGLFAKESCFLLEHKSQDQIDAFLYKKRDAKYDLPGKIDLNELPIDNSHAIVLDWVPRSAHVLDVACATGYLGEYLTDQKQCLVDGIELDSRAASKAERVYHQVYRGSVEDGELLRNIQSTYDVILCAAVLEHLVDPVSVLTSLKPLLNREGFVIVSLPNIAHWQVRWELLRGRFEYQDYGILDRTHLHFYTPEGMRALFHECEFEVANEAFSIYGPSDLDSPLLNIPFYGKQIRQRLVSQFPGLFAQEFVFKLIPEKTN